MSLGTLGYAGLEQAFNQYLRLDPDTRQAMGRLHGRVFAFDVEGLGRSFYLVPGPSGEVQILATYEGEPDCRLRGTPLALARMNDHRASAEQLFSGQVEIQGDTELAHRLGKILGAMDIDWEEQLSQLTGDLIAHHVGNLARDAAGWGRNTLHTLGLDLQEYLQEESRVIPGRSEIEAFLADVDRLRDDVERLQARISLLQARAGHPGAEE